MLTYFKLLDTKNPFVPLWSCDGQRSIALRDFKKEHGQLFAQFAEYVQDPELASRLGDLGWMISRNTKAGNIAIEAYMKASDSEYCQNL